MANAKSTTPALRFKGFYEEWEERKISELLLERNEQMPSSEDYPLMAFIANMGVAPKGERYDRSSLVSDTVNKLYKKTEYGDFIYSSNNLETGSIGLNEYGKATISPVYSIFQPTELANPDFMGRRLTRSDFITEMIRWRQGVIYGQWRIHESDFLKIEISTPSVKEQRKIGQYLARLDSLIALQRRKLVKLQNVKKAMLQKMFPTRGSTTPQIRFAGFTEPWQEQKLGDLAEIVRGASPRPIKDPRWFNSDSEIGWLRISDVTEQDGRIQYLEQRLSAEGQEHTRVLTEPHLLLSIAATVGKPLVNYVPTGVHDGFLIFLNPQFDREFMFQWLEMFRPQWSQYGQPGSQVNLNSDLVKNKTLLLPDEKEQIKIGIYFKHLDTRISLQQRKLEKLQNVKKACLAAMFV